MGRAWIQAGGTCDESSTPYCVTPNKYCHSGFDPLEPYSVHSPGVRPHLRPPVLPSSMSTSAGPHSRGASRASSSDPFEPDPPYQQPWLNRLVILFIWFHNAIIIPFVLHFTSALYAAICQALGRPKCPTPDSSNGAIVVLNSTAGNPSSNLFPRGFPPNIQSAFFQENDRFPTWGTLSLSLYPFDSQSNWRIYLSGIGRDIALTLASVGLRPSRHTYTLTKLSKARLDSFRLWRNP
jgi:hypothetical protein